MKLSELDGRFVYDAGEKSYRISDSHSVDGMQGVLFQCPSCGIGRPHGCEGERHYIVGDHYILVFFSNPKNATPAPESARRRNDGTPNPLWTMSGSTLDDLTLSPSIDCTRGGGCTFHGFVSSGNVG